MEKIVWTLRKKIVEKFLEHKIFLKIFLTFFFISLYLPQTSLHLPHITLKFLLSSFQFNTRIFAADFLCNKLHFSIKFMFNFTQISIKILSSLVTNY